jgi:hypothetical protein
MFLRIISDKFWLDGKLIGDDLYDDRGDTPPYYINSDIIRKIHVIYLSDGWQGFAEVKQGQICELLPLTKIRDSRVDILFELQLMMREINEADNPRKVDSSSELKFA